MDTPTKILVLERMRELLADPERVVLDPMHCFETADGDEAALFTDRATESGCRVCFCGAASVAAFEIVGGRGFITARDMQMKIADKVEALGIPLDEDVRAEYGPSYVGILTSALKQGRAIEVIDAVLADVRPNARDICGAGR